ncbi:hypothetical protein D3C72_2437220 [compost metagenome]
MVSLSRMRAVSAGVSSLICMPLLLRSASALAASARVSWRSKSRLFLAASSSTFCSSLERPSQYFLLTVTIQGLYTWLVTDRYFCTS